MSSKKRSKSKRPSSSRSLILLDSAHIRRKAWAACKRARTTFETAERDLLNAETNDQRAYDRWFRLTFGSLIEENKRIVQEIDALQLVYWELNQLQMQRGCSPQEAYARWERGERAKQAEQEESAGGPPPPEYDEDELELIELSIYDFLEMEPPPIDTWVENGFSNEEILHVASIIIASEFEEDAAFVRMLLDRPKLRGLLDRQGLPSGSREKTKSSKDDNTTDDATRIKQLARELAFALHPDQAGNEDPKRLEMWHEVQEAISQQDLDRLEALHAHHHLMEGGDANNSALSVSRIYELTRMFRRSREAVRNKLHLMKKEAWWKFSEVPEADKEQLIAPIQGLLKQKKQQNQDQLEELLAELRSWKRGQPSGDQQRSRGPSLTDLFTDDSYGV